MCVCVCVGDLRKNSFLQDVICVSAMGDRRLRMDSPPGSVRRGDLGLARRSAYVEIPDRGGRPDFLKVGDP